MSEVKTTRNTWVACPKCGRKVAKVRTCDMELKCKHCGCEFEAVIGISNATMVREDQMHYRTSAEKKADLMTKPKEEK